MNTFYKEMHMSHLVQTMAYQGQTPWHGLGHELPAGQSIDTWAVSAGMNWSIEQTPVRYVTGQDDGMVSIGSFEEQQVLYRSDRRAAVSTPTTHRTSSIGQPKQRPGQPWKWRKASNTTAAQKAPCLTG